MSKSNLDQVNAALRTNGLTAAVADFLTELLARIERLEGEAEPRGARR